MLEEWEKTGPRILKSLAGTEERLMIVLLSHSTTSIAPVRSNLIHSLAPPAFFFAFPVVPAATDPPALIGEGGGGDEGLDD